MQKWLSGRASPCQGEGREFKSRLLLHFYVKFGGNGKKATPVPIPNTEVKLLSADDTWGAAPWESRTSPI